MYLHVLYMITSITIRQTNPDATETQPRYHHTHTCPMFRHATNAARHIAVQCSDITTPYLPTYVHYTYSTNGTMHAHTKEQTRKGKPRSFPSFLFLCAAWHTHPLPLLLSAKHHQLGRPTHWGLRKFVSSSPSSVAI